MSISGTRLRAGLTAALLASSVLSSGALIAQPAAAQAAQEYLFDLPAMPARRSLAEIGRITGLSVVYDETPAASVTAAPVSGNLTPAQALARALAPTGLNYAISGDTVVIGNGASQAAAKAAPGDGEAIVLETITIEAESNETLQQRGYIALSGRQAMRIETDIKELPQSVSVVTQDQMEDQGPRTLLDALDYTAGVTTGNYGFDSRYDSYHLRGFGAYQVGNFLDGLRSYNGLSSWYKAEPYLLEGIAILKGPVSSNFGVSTPGGVVNMVTKRPKDTAYNEIRLGDCRNGRSLQSRQTTDVVLQTLLMAVWRRKPKSRVLVHSDQGAQFTSMDWAAFLKHHNLEHSMSRRGNCHDNAVAESFFNLLKRERIRRRTYRTREEARQDVFDYIEMFYNPKRKHVRNGMLSPVEFERQQEM